LAKKCIPPKRQPQRRNSMTEITTQGEKTIMMKMGKDIENYKGIWQ